MSATPTTVHATSAEDLYGCIRRRFPEDYGYQMHLRHLDVDEIGEPANVEARVSTRDGAYSILQMNADCQTFRKVIRIEPGEFKKFRIAQGSFLKFIYHSNELPPVVLGPVSGDSPPGYGGASFAFQSTTVLWSQSQGIAQP